MLSCFRCLSKSEKDGVEGGGGAKVSLIHSLTHQAPLDEKWNFLCVLHQDI